MTVWIDPAGLRPPGTDVLNGIAYDVPGKRLFVTGKLWPPLYEIAVYRPHRFFLLLVTKRAVGDPLPTPTSQPGE